MSSEIIKYLVVGLGSNALNFLLYTIIFSLTGTLWIASISGYVFGLFLSYTGARIWIFGQVFESSLKLLAAFCMVYVVGGIGMTLVIIFLTRKVGWTTASLADWGVICGCQ